MAKTRSQKEVELKQIIDNLSKAKAVVLADYQGMNMKQLSDLRDVLRDQNAQLVITKNTLLKKAMENCKLKIENSVFNGPTATLFAYDDEISPIKALVKVIKDSGIGKIKLGFLGSDLMDEAGIQKLATLLSKDELRGKTVGVLVAPLQGMVGVLQVNLRNLVYAISEIQKAKGGDANASS